MNIEELRAQIREHRKAIKAAMTERRRHADRIEAIRTEPIETDPDYRAAQIQHQRARIALATEALRAAEAEVQRTTEAAVAFARTVRAQATAADAVTLSDAEWTKAGIVQGILEVELAGASPATIADRLEGVTLTGDRAEQYAAALVLDPLLAAAIPRDEEERRRISAARQTIRDIRTSLRPAELEELATAARDLIGTAGQAGDVIHADRMERRDFGASDFQPKPAGRTVRLVGDDRVGYGAAPDDDDDLAS